MATITTTEFAAALDTTPREARKFLRSADSGVAPVGKGAKYMIEKRDLRSLKARHARWAKAIADAKVTPEVADEVEVTPDDAA